MSTRRALPETHVPEPLRPLMQSIATASISLARLIARNGIEHKLGADAEATNAGGDSQKALDVWADDLFLKAARDGGVRHYASEEQDRVVDLGAGDWALAIDPLDGSSNIDTNVSIGTIFSIYAAADTPDASFLRPVSEQVGAGYVIYGPQTALVVTLGQGVQRYALDYDTGAFVLVEPQVSIPPESNEFAVNASNYRHWPKPIRAYVDDCVAGVDGPRGKNFNMRWIASLVAEAHRILARGGVFLYPADDRKGYERGRLRLLYECAPIAMLCAQAGGGATDGTDPILQMRVETLHQRTPFIFGTRAKVARIAAYHDMPEIESALFGRRGLFRS
ncbi:class 1 fructose-bisphosphatase [Pseudogemmobacter blasticus]|uniref:Fructose-1,6-bisphosphatase class 1 n=1 Tax=Fuscovulum blasticum DSM 2131 TaxID=1188250 RepID=A0A2T4JBJ5_FUSBL|nr:class 1 fructose-bisphosphatase [Fuscovulum blasticum]PTE15290.1 class 1 fructose-bisphosphatase [Fuscovulum blasticum DSM 2131]